MDRKQLIMEYLSKQIRIFRRKEKYTQEIMAEKLHIASRSYFDLEHGISGFSTMFLLYFIVLLSEEEAIRMIKNFRRMLRGSEGNAA